MSTELSEAEWEFRRRRYEQLRDQIKDPLPAMIAEAIAEREAGRAELDLILDRFRSSRDAQALRQELDSWSRDRERYGFAGPNGAMLLNQLVKDGDADLGTDLLIRLLTPPTDELAAESFLNEFAAFVEQCRARGSQAAVGRTAAFCSWFWWLAEPEKWPVAWSSARSVLEGLGFIDQDQGPWAGYADYRNHIHQLGEFKEVEQVFSHVYKNGSFGIDVTAAERLELVSLAPTAEIDSEAFGHNVTSVQLLCDAAKSLGKSLQPALAELFGSKVKRRQSSPYWKDGRLRENTFVSWTPASEELSPSLYLVVAPYGVQIGLHGQSLTKGAKGFSTRTHAALHGAEPANTKWMVMGPNLQGRDPSEIPGWAILGRLYSLDELADHTAVEQAVLTTAADLLPSFERVRAGERSTSVGQSDSEPPTKRGDETQSTVKELVATFLSETSYPTANDRRDQAAQVEWSRTLAKGRVASAPLDEIRRIYGGGLYGNPGPQSILHTTLADEDPAIVDRFLTAIEFLLWDEESAVADRINRVMDESDLGLRGFKEGAIMKLLAVAHSEQFLAVYPFTGDKGKAAMLGVLGLDVPSLSESVGDRQIKSTRALKAIVEPLFPGDSWGQSKFLYWLMSRSEDEGRPSLDELLVLPEEDLVGEAADDLLLPRVFLEEIAGLLEQHRQVVFYGPPGTGKTYAAQRLAEALAPGDEQRLLIQFHPSTSYEDFFEGYRPLASGDDQMVYKLVSGPLRIMAERAAADPLERPHLLIIDEINRANLAKVLGELLFLLEYRKKEIHPLYRPAETFSLPENLWIIGTMNTADRSIATVDAALRRRFHFVPFVPDDQEENPISGLLGRWLEDNDEPAWVADLVDGVNQNLRAEMGGDHSLLGPSYFMQEGMSRASLAQIWKYRIEPLIEDLFFGDERAARFRFERVWNEFQAQGGGE